VSLRISTITVCALALIVSACATVEPGRATGRGIDDMNASASLKSSMMRAEGFALGGIDVEVTEGVALLAGHAPRQEDLDYAACLAWSTPGVRTVALTAEVGPGRGPGQVTRDLWITQQVRMRLMGDSTIRSTNYNIDTHSGVVHLLGFARDAEERERAASHAALVNGVERVIVLVRTGGEPMLTPARGEMQAAVCEPAPQLTASRPQDPDLSPDTAPF